ncbi:energy-coupling factor transporter ATP-binding protein EcfA2 [Azospirillum lipoferum]|nr:MULTISPECIES: P-loop NTPase fold protein [Azospirillum]MCP1613547.1 energy-coupling factor transporter ATP-binding protein EcfA2 [Azospirillum lipoferum]MDW5532311.1 P-loop NTPase fold protein [Azospirillum sp. NL1]
MSDRQDTVDALLPEHRPDRPIATAGQDTLGRDSFVRRLARAMVRDGRASGVVVGLTGPWGSGKSSILNLLAEELKAAAQRDGRPAPVVVRFDPWLVSGRDDVISQFFAELLATIKEVGTKAGRNGDALLDLANKLFGYAKELGPVFDLALPGYGKAAAAGFKAGERLTQRDVSLSKQKRELTEMLGGVAVPIVVLVDELDRVEDAEVRAVAQLVRAVADFPGISYLLAYDRSRVVEALGGKDKERGAAYLEKIVQLEVRIPVTLAREGQDLFLSEFERLAEVAALPQGWRQDARFVRMLGVMQTQLLTTPRDVRRVCGCYAVLRSMTVDEVDWIDLLGYATLQTKAPEVIERISLRPDLVTNDPPPDATVNFDWGRFFGKEGQPTSDDRLKALDVTSDGPIAHLLEILFPALRKVNLAPWEARVPPDGVRFYRALMTALRLDLVPGGVTRKEIVTILEADRNTMAERLKTLQTEGRLIIFYDRLCSIFPEVSAHDPEALLIALGRLPQRVFAHEPNQAILLSVWFERYATFIARQSGSAASTIANALQGLITAGQYDAAAAFLLPEAQGRGFYPGPQRRARWCMPEEVVRELTTDLSGRVAEALRDGPIDAVLTSPFPLMLAVTSGNWTSEAHASLSRRVENDEAVLLSMTLIFYSCGTIDEEGLNRYLDPAAFRRGLDGLTPQSAGWSGRAAVAARAQAMIALSA